MTTIYVLEHSYEQDSCDETKFIGVYSSNEEAESAIERLKTKPGFRDRREGFHIDKYELNKDNWTEGFSSMTVIQVKDKKGNWKPVQAEILIDGNYQIVENYEDELLGEFHNLDIVKCEDREGQIFAVSVIEKYDTNDKKS